MYYTFVVHLVCDELAATFSGFCLRELSCSEPHNRAPQDLYDAMILRTLYELSSYVLMTSGNFTVNIQLVGFHR